MDGLKHIMDAFAAVTCLISVIVGTHLPGGLLLGFPSSGQAGGSLLREEYQRSCNKKTAIV